MDVTGMVREAYERLDRGDAHGLLELCAPNVKVFIGGTTRISGDHERGGVPRVVAQMAERKPRREIIDISEVSGGAVVTLHEHVDRDGTEHGYHAIHVWDVRDGRVAHWWFYLHEYDKFEEAWT